MKPKRLRHFVKQWREYRRLTQAELAGRVGTTQSILSSTETHERRVDIDFLAPIAGELGVSVEELVLVDPIKLDPATAAYAQISEAITLLKEAGPEQREAAIRGLRAILGKEEIV